MLIPEENQRDLADIPKNIKQNLEIRPVKWIDEVWQIALKRMPEALPAENEPPVADVGRTATRKTKKGNQLRTH